MPQTKSKTTGENTIEIKSVRSLLGEKFFVPDYQRGYRWTEQQVKDLLEDIYEFSCKVSKCKVSKTPGEFYCLQPLVVKEILDEEKEKYQLCKSEKWYEVIDGQQRLTTIFLIILYLKQCRKIEAIGLPEDIYELKYQREANEDQGYLNRIVEFNFEKVDNSSIDHFHITKACCTIRKWFDEKKANKGKFCNTLLDLDKKTQRDDANNVRFIWYESKNEDSVEVFTRLNTGKIELTNSELIKALFLNSSNFGEDSDEYIRLRQREIASEWDQIEYTLQNEEFWQFIHNGDYKKPTRIDFIFDLICEQESDSVNNTDSYKTFRHFYGFFKNAKKVRKCIEDAKKNTEEAEKFIKEARELIEDVKGEIEWENTDDVDKGIKEVEDKAEKCDTIYRWKEVKKIFQTLEEWFNDLELYHYIGYLIVRGTKVKDLLEDWNESENKNQFIGILKDKIREKIKIEVKIGKRTERRCDLNQQYEYDKCPSKRCSHPLLLLHNIQTVINQCKNSTETYGMQVFYKFPFHIYKNEKWDVEHIDPATPNDLSDPEDQKEWLLNVYGMLKDVFEEKKKVGENPRDFPKEIYHFLNKDQEAKDFKDLKDGILTELGAKDGDLEDDEKNQIMNFALLDSGTNRGYGNAIFAAKRRWIIGKDMGKSIPIPTEGQVFNDFDPSGEKKDNSAEEEESKEKGKSSFVPPCTKQIFLKYYSAVSFNPNYWTRRDAEAYKKNIFETLEEFLIPKEEPKNE